MTLVGHVREICFYPVKSMAGVVVPSCMLGWHGLAGDRRFAFRRVGDAGGFPWLSASRLPDLLRYQPIHLDESTGEPLPTQVRTPAGACLELRGPELTAELVQRFGGPLELMMLKHGVFDEAPLSLLSLATVAIIGRGAGLELDRRCFRPNLVIETASSEPFPEDAWVGGTVVFGSRDTGPAVNVTQRDLRCSMLNLHPETAMQDARILKAVAELNETYAGVYATVVRTGEIRVGDTVSLI